MLVTVKEGICQDVGTGAELLFLPDSCITLQTLVIALQFFV